MTGSKESKTIFETLGDRCALCALEPHVQLTAGKEKHGLSWQRVFQLGFFLGRYMQDETNYCEAHKTVMQETVPKLLLQVGIVTADPRKLVR